eukprot:CAMPEP_0194310830 /NCGR_PEP_ID=MMETSP0171-20130528/7814_1 /TAXON_ID=218684 /ORGANISM="Corethron pennatum, Strain L29A3" /LENGTH=214 /DNA_ID=CAMNT_0039064659 /DNA_START=303 /DNA_END=947 /DNA_ORIENTATION=+
MTKYRQHWQSKKRFSDRAHPELHVAADHAREGRRAAAHAHPDALVRPEGLDKHLATTVDHRPVRAETVRTVDEPPQCHNLLHPPQVAVEGAVDRREQPQARVAGSHARVALGDPSGSDLSFEHGAVVVGAHVCGGAQRPRHRTVDGLFIRVDEAVRSDGDRADGALRGWQMDFISDGARNNGTAAVGDGRREESSAAQDGRARGEEAQHWRDQM